MAISYASEKLQDAIRFLACSDKSLEERLDSAIAEIILLRSERDFPIELHQDFEKLISTISEYRKEENQQLLMRNIAEQAFYLLVKVERIHDFVINKRQDYNQ